MAKEKDLVQRTLVLCKPDAVQRGIVGEIIQRFERVGLKIVGIKMVSPDADLYEKHYEEIGKLITRRGEQTFRYNLNYMLTGPVIAICLEGVEAVELVRKIVGPTEPKSALSKKQKKKFLSGSNLKKPTITKTSTKNTLAVTGNSKITPKGVIFYSQTTFVTNSLHPPIAGS